MTCRQTQVDCQLAGRDTSLVELMIDGLKESLHGPEDTVSVDHQQDRATTWLRLRKPDGYE